MAIHIVSVDLQNAFCAEGGALYRPRPCVPFITQKLLPFVRERGYRIAEIISDYRSAERGSSSGCVPGEWGYQSLSPADLKHPSVWVKAAPSPAWTRAGAGRADQRPGEPYPDPDAFSAWLRTTIGAPSADQEIILIGVMLEICVLSTLQELKYRGYQVKVLSEGVDTFSGSLEQKQQLFEALFPFWGQALSWAQLQEISA